MGHGGGPITTEHTGGGLGGGGGEPPRAGETPLSVKSTYEQKNDFIHVTKLPLDVTPGDGWAVRDRVILNLTIKRCLTGP